MGQRRSDSPEVAATISATSGTSRSSAWRSSSWPVARFPCLQCAPKAVRYWRALIHECGDQGSFCRAEVKNCMNLSEWPADLDLVQQARELGVLPMLHHPVCLVYDKERELPGMGRHQKTRGSTKGHARQAPDTAAPAAGCNKQQRRELHTSCPEGACPHAG